MTEFAARIRSVRPKHSNVHLMMLPTPVNEDGENIAGAMLRGAKMVAGYDEPGSRLDGYILIGLFEDGKRSVGFRIPSRLPRDLMPAYVAEMLRRDAITAHEAAEEFDRRFEWQE